MVFFNIMPDFIGKLNKEVLLKIKTYISEKFEYKFYFRSEIKKKQFF